MNNDDLLNSVDLLCMIPANIYWKDIYGVYFGCNQQLAQFLNLASSDDIIGKTAYDLLPKKYADAVEQFDRTLMVEARTKVCEEEGVNLDGNERIFLSTKAPLYAENGKVIGLIGISFDITERKKFESSLALAKSAAETANRAKSDFIMNMRHDLKTPCSGILGFSRILQENEADPEKKVALGHIVKSSEKLIELFDEMIEVCDMGTDSTKLIKSTFDIKQLVHDVVNLLSPQAKMGDIQIVSKIAESLPSFIISDKIRIHRILLNLLSNAIKFTKEGVITSSITYDQLDDEHLMLCLKIKDTGIGIQQSKLNSIFNKFVRLGSPSKAAYQGSGLGLFLVKTFIDDLHGQINVISEVGKGTCFTCEIPVKIPPQNAGAEIATAFIDLPRLDYRETYRTLIIEDDAIARIIATRLLEKYHCQIDIAVNGKQALELLAEKYDLIFMDIGLPDISGYQLTQQIRSMESNSQTPIIALSAHVDHNDIQQARKYGLDALLTKPLTQDHFHTLFPKRS